MNLYLLAAVQLKYYEYIVYILISAHSPKDWKGTEKASKGKSRKKKKVMEKSTKIILCPFYETSNYPS